MWRTILLYAVALAVAAAALEWLEYRYVTRRFSTEFYIAVIPRFRGLRVWAGRSDAAPSPRLRRNEARSARSAHPARLRDLALLASGTNKNGPDARISPNTVKTHVALVYEKLMSSSRAGDESALASLFRCGSGQITL